MENKKCCRNADCDGFETCEECWADWQERQGDQHAEVQELIERLRKYSEQEYNAHNNCIAEDLMDAANLLEQLIAPSDDAKSVAHGRWLRVESKTSEAMEYECSLCGRRNPKKEKYCPECGGMMDL